MGACQVFGDFSKLQNLQTPLIISFPTDIATPVQTMSPTLNPSPIPTSFVQIITPVYPLGGYVNADVPTLVYIKPTPFAARCIVTYLTSQTDGTTYVDCNCGGIGSEQCPTGTPIPTFLPEGEYEWRVQGCRYTIIQYCAPSGGSHFTLDRSITVTATLTPVPTYTGTPE